MLALAHIGEGGGRDRFSTIEKRRRCDCAGGRAQAARVSETESSDESAMTYRGRRLAEVGIPLTPMPAHILGRPYLGQTLPILARVLIPYWRGR